LHLTFLHAPGISGALAQSVSAEPATCWPTGTLTFDAGTREAVLERSADFLIAAEDLPTHPYWPGGESGITMGVGWDLGQHSESELLRAWAALDLTTLGQLKIAIHKRGHDAEVLAPRLKAIAVPRNISLSVFRTSLADAYYPMTLRLFPRVETLPAEVQVALLSLVFNRGVLLGRDPDWSKAKELDRRWEIRRLQDDVKQRDLFAIYVHLGTMKRLWEKSGQRGLLYRRRDEQHLIRPYVDRELLWEENRDKLKAAGLPSCTKLLEHMNEERPHKRHLKAKLVLWRLRVVRAETARGGPIPGTALLLISKRRTKNIGELRTCRNSKFIPRSAPKVSGA